jgi:hypothetical protein
MNTNRTALTVLSLLLVLGLPLAAQEDEAFDPPEPEHLESEEIERHSRRARRSPHFRGDPEQRMEALRDWMHREMPELAEKLRDLHSRQPRVFISFMHELADRKMRHVLHNIRRDKDGESRDITKNLLSNEYQSMLMAHEYRRVENPEEKERIYAELRTVVQRSFELKERLQVKMLEKMESRISRVREMIQKRRELKARIIEERLEELTLERDMIDW